MYRHRTTVMAVVAAGALALAGCGGEDGPTLAEFAKQADKVCDDGEKKLEGVERPQDVEAVPQFADDVKKVAGDVSKQMGDLEKPSGDDGKKAEEFVDSFQADISNQLVPKLDEIKQAAEGGNEKETVAALQEIGEIENDRTEKLASDIGAKACAE